MSVMIEKKWDLEKRSDNRWRRVWEEVFFLIYSKIRSRVSCYYLVWK